MGRNRRTGGRRGEKGGGGGGVESGPPVVTGRPGLMSKANMMLTFLQGSAVWTARGPRGPSGLQGPPSLGIMHMNGPPHEYHPILPGRAPPLSSESHDPRCREPDWQSDICRQFPVSASIIHSRRGGRSHQTPFRNHSTLRVVEFRETLQTLWSWFW